VPTQHAPPACRRPTPPPPPPSPHAALSLSESLGAWHPPPPPLQELAELLAGTGGRMRTGDGHPLQ